MREVQKDKVQGFQNPIASHRASANDSKCDGEFPCKRCKDSGFVCSTAARKSTRYKYMPHEDMAAWNDTHVALVNTVHKLYAMVRNRQPWDLGEPEVNDKGEPAIHSIASELGYVPPTTEVDDPSPLVPRAGPVVQPQEPDKKPSAVGKALTSFGSLPRDCQVPSDETVFDYYTSMEMSAERSVGANAKGVHSFCDISSPCQQHDDPRPTTSFFSDLPQEYIQPDSSGSSSDLATEGLTEFPFDMFMMPLVLCPHSQVAVGMGGAFIGHGIVDAGLEG